MKNKWFITCYIFLLICVYIIPICNYPKIKYEYLSQRKTMKSLREAKYVADLISHIYNKYDGIILLPISFYDKYAKATQTFRPKCFDSRPEIGEKMSELIDKEVDQKKSRLFTYKIYDMPESENDYINYKF